MKYLIKYESWFSSFRDKIQSNLQEEQKRTKEVLNKDLMKAIENNNYKLFCMLINNGADVNYTFSPFKNKLNSPLLNVVFGWTHSENDQVKFLKKLIDKNVNTFNITLMVPEGDYQFDFIETISKLMSKKSSKKVIDYLLEKQPNYLEEREMYLNTDKYNL